MERDAATAQLSEACTNIHLDSSIRIQLATAALKAGADINYCPRSPDDTMLQKIIHHGHPDLIALLLVHGADVHVKASGTQLPQFSPLCDAIWVRRTDVVAQLIAWVREQGQDVAAFVNERVKGGFSALHSAATLNGTDAIAQMLLEAGADPTAKSDTGYTPLHAAVGTPNNDGSEALIQMLLDAVVYRGGNVAAFVNGADASGVSALDLARRNKKGSAIVTLLESALTALPSPMRNRVQPRNPGPQRER